MASSSVPEDEGDDGANSSDGRFSGSVCGSLDAGGGGRKDDRRVWTARKALCCPVKGVEDC